MSKFDAGTAVEALEYDFTKYSAGVAGEIPEPTTAQITEFFDSVRALAKEVLALQSSAKRIDDGEDLSDEESTAILTQLEELDLEGYQSRMVDMVAALCSNSPSADQIRILPFRVRQAFLGWVAGEFRPEAQAATTTR